jgi:ArsR family transcriptional regulator
MKSKICGCEDAPSYSKELKELTERVANTEEARMRGKLFKALADETRLRILKLLEVREMCVCEIMVALGLTQPTASHHLGILENVGLAKGRKEGKWVFYSARDQETIRAIDKLKPLQ